MRSRPARADRLLQALALLAWLVGAGESAAERPSIATVTTEGAERLQLRLSGDWSHEVLLDPARWWVSSIDPRDGVERALHPARVAFEGQILELTLAEPLEQAREHSVRFFRPPAEGGSIAAAFFTSPAGGSTGKGSSGAGSPTYEAARCKDDADIYVTGNLAAGRGARPTYAGEVLLRHDFIDGGGGRAGLSFEVSWADERNVDPDMLEAGVSYRRNITRAVSDMMERTGLGLELRMNPLSFEYARHAGRSNLATQAQLAALPQAVKLGRDWLALEPFVGFEAGRNLEGGGEGNPRTVFRPQVGLHALLLRVRSGGDSASRLMLSADLMLRLPMTREPLAEEHDGQRLVRYTRGARPHLGADLMLELTEGYCFMLQYRHGSLPPAFERVEHRVSLGFTLRRKRVRSGV